MAGSARRTARGPDHVASTIWRCPGIAPRAAGDAADRGAARRSLPVPVVVDPDGPLGSRALRDGRRLFEQAGCASRHAPTLGDVAGIYGDLLLHDLGQSLSDPGSNFGLDGPDTPPAPRPPEWRSPPLWGFRDPGPNLHDGRARDLEEAVAFHDGQARAELSLAQSLEGIRPPARSASIPRSPATPPAPTRADSPSSGSMSSARGSSRPDRDHSEPSGGARRRTSSRAWGLPSPTAARSSSAAAAWLPRASWTSARS